MVAAAGRACPGALVDVMLGLLASSLALPLVDASGRSLLGNGGGVDLIEIDVDPSLFQRAGAALGTAP